SNAVAFISVKSVLNVKLCTSSEDFLVFVPEPRGGVLVLPQACLAAKRKGNRVQYHGLVFKSTGEELPRKSVQQRETLIAERPVRRKRDVRAAARTVTGKSCRWKRTDLSRM
ncbi:unnamed protein product, partial [Ixodes hexagonus]